MRVVAKNWVDRLMARYVAGFPFDVTRHVIELPGLADELAGLTVVHLSDLHLDRWNRPVVEAAVDVVRALRPDVLVCTGDVISQGMQFLPDVAYLLGQMPARYAKLACMGNHDYSDGRDGVGVRQALTQAGFQVLINASVDVCVPGRGVLPVMGVDDWLVRRRAVWRTLQDWGAMDVGPALMLSHHPAVASWLPGSMSGFMVSGHTHGGQVKLPMGVRRRLLSTPYVAGLYPLESPGQTLYVNRGLGAAVFVHHWGHGRIAVPTPRILVRPELSVFELRPSAENENRPCKLADQLIQDVS